MASMGKMPVKVKACWRREREEVGVDERRVRGKSAHPMHLSTWVLLLFTCPLVVTSCGTSKARRWGRAAGVEEEEKEEEEARLM